MRVGWPAVALIAAPLISPLSAFESVAQQPRNCETALSRIAKASVVKAIEQNRNSACGGIKSGAIGIDKTKELKLASFEFCEAGSVIDATVSVKITCATSDAAFIKLEVSDTATATAAADLDTCKVLRASASAENLVSQAGLDLAGVDARLRDGIAQLIKPYCKQ